MYTPDDIVAAIKNYYRSIMTDLQVSTESSSVNAANTVSTGTDTYWGTKHPQKRQAPAATPIAASTVRELK